MNIQSLPGYLCDRCFTGVEFPIFIRDFTKPYKLGMYHYHKTCFDIVSKERPHWQGLEERGWIKVWP